MQNTINRHMNASLDEDYRGQAISQDMLDELLSIKPKRLTDETFILNPSKDCYSETEDVKKLKEKIIETIKNDFEDNGLSEQYIDLINLSPTEYSVQEHFKDFLKKVEQSEKMKKDIKNVVKSYDTNLKEYNSIAAQCHELFTGKEQKVKGLSKIEKEYRELKNKCWDSISVGSFDDGTGRKLNVVYKDDKCFDIYIGDKKLRFTKSKITIANKFSLQNYFIAWNDETYFPLSFITDDAWITNLEKYKDTIAFEVFTDKICKKISKSKYLSDNVYDFNLRGELHFDTRFFDYEPLNKIYKEQSSEMFKNDAALHNAIADISKSNIVARMDNLSETDYLSTSCYVTSDTPARMDDESLIKQAQEAVYKKAAEIVKNGSPAVKKYVDENFPELKAFMSKEKKTRGKQL